MGKLRLGQAQRLGLSWEGLQGSFPLPSEGTVSGRPPSRARRGQQTTSESHAASEPSPGRSTRRPFPGGGGHTRLPRRTVREVEALLRSHGSWTRHQPGPGLGWALREPPHFPPTASPELRPGAPRTQADPCGKAGPLPGCRGPPRAGLPAHGKRWSEASTPLFRLPVVGWGLSLCDPLSSDGLRTPALLGAGLRGAGQL